MELRPFGIDVVIEPGAIRTEWVLITSGYELAGKLATRQRTATGPAPEPPAP